MADKKKFKDTAIGKFVKNKLPDALQVIGDNLPVPHALTNMITGLIKPEDKAEFDAAMQEYTQSDYDFLLAQEKEITDRWKADMASDSWLSKNVRPLVLLYMLGVFTALVVCDSAHINFVVRDSWVSLLETLMTAVFVAYFGSRGFEKIQNQKYKK